MEGIISVYHKLMFSFPFLVYLFSIFIVPARNVIPSIWIQLEKGVVLHITYLFIYKMEA